MEGSRIDLLTNKMNTKIKSEKFTGSYGIVIIPDKETCRQALLLAKELSRDIDFKDPTPHITLYHARFSELPKRVVMSTLDQLKLFLGLELELSELQVYGSKFLFWNIKKNTCIQHMHEEALRISKYLDRKSVSRAIEEEKLDLSDEELRLIKNYGHPLIKHHYIPHITLAYSASGIQLPMMSYKRRIMRVEDIIFAEIGDYGVVRRKVI